CGSPAEPPPCLWQCHWAPAPRPGRLRPNRRRPDQRPLNHSPTSRSATPMPRAWAPGPTPRSADGRPWGCRASWTPRTPSSWQRTPPAPGPSPRRRP
ncbi:MAG: hypothetical protein AVDCRST_MAG88-1015, partial [uncultured Thermomicrobiales bacterium]